MRSCSLVLLSVCIFAPAVARADVVDLIQNGGFELGHIFPRKGDAPSYTFPLGTFFLGPLYDVADWTIYDPNYPGYDATGVCTTANCQKYFKPNAGDSAVWGGAFNGVALNLNPSEETNGAGVPGTVTQFVHTVAGKSYVLTFYLAEWGTTESNPDNYWNVKWNNQQVGDTPDHPHTPDVSDDGAGTNVLSGNPTGGIPELNYVKHSFSITGTGGLDKLEFSFFDQSGFAFGLDDVSLVGPAPVAEPGVATLLFSMMAGLAGAIGLLRKKLAS